MCICACCIFFGFLQDLIEQPTIHMIAPSTSSGENQHSLVGDKVERLKEMSKPLVASNGVTITDTMRFFLWR